MHRDDNLIFGCLGGTALICVLCIAAWCTHVIVCIKTASWFLLGFGAVAFPVGIAHGIGVWLGVL